MSFQFRLKWGRGRDQSRVVEMLLVPRTGEYVSVRGTGVEPDEQRYRVTDVDHLVDERQPDGVPATGVTAVLWCKEIK